MQAGQDKGWKIGGSPMEGTVEVMGGALAVITKAARVV